MKLLSALLCVVLLAMMGLPALADALPTLPSADNGSAAQGAGDDALPAPPQDEGAALGVLPNPGSFLGDAGQLNQEGYSYQGASWSVWYYTQGSDWGAQVTEWIKACRSAGYDYAPDTVSGQTVHVVSGDGLKAMLFPDYSGSVMVMVQDGLEMADYEAPVKEALKLGQAHIIWNGRDYGVVDNVSFRDWGGYWDASVVLKNMPIHNMVFVIPSSLQTGDHLHYNKGNRPKDMSSSLWVDNKFLYDKWADSMSSEEDYVDIDIIYCDGKELRLTLDGLFHSSGNDETTVYMEIYAPVSKG